MAISVDLSGSVCVVTGISDGGLGPGIAARFVDAGASVALIYRSAAEFATKLAADLSDGDVQVEAFACKDLSDANQVLTVFEQVRNRFGRIDTLVNNAGVQPVVRLAEMTSAEWELVMAVNTGSVFAATQAAVEAMAMTGGGSVINIASIEGHRAAKGHAHYSASKAAILMHTKAAAVECADAGVRVNSVSPGLIDRPGLDDAWPSGVERWKSVAPLGRLGTPEDIGSACVFLASPLASWMTGVDIIVDGGVSVRPTW